ncbi:hypothetical protein FACS1894137_04020 [Spirochaetia bacterium]|nr:hypothetical protein FACS1894137_04020 [Spirochaetia bacterium]
MFDTPLSDSGAALWEKAVANLQHSAAALHNLMQEVEEEKGGPWFRALVPNYLFFTYT